MLCVARGKVSEGIDFDHHYGRTVLCIGEFYALTSSQEYNPKLTIPRFQVSRFSTRNPEFSKRD